MKRIMFVLFLAALMAGCVTMRNRQIINRELSVEAMLVNLVSIAGPVDSFAQGNTTYSPKDASKGIYFVNVEFTNQSPSPIKISPLLARLENTRAVVAIEGNKDINVAQQYDYCGFLDTFGGAFAAIGGKTAEQSLELAPGEKICRQFVFVYSKSEAPGQFIWHNFDPDEKERGKGMRNTVTIPVAVPAK